MKLRFLPLTDDNRSAMLETIGVKSVDDFFAEVPSKAKHNAPISELPKHKSEMEVEAHMAALAAKNLHAGEAPSFCGAGAYRHHIPASVDQLLTRGEFLTSYTPYQPEVSQGTLQAVFEFQTQVALLTGMDIANASMYDGSTAAMEAVLMANRLTKHSKAVLSGGLHPHYIEVIETQSRLAGFEVKTLPPTHHQSENISAEIADDVSCLVVQSPDFFGRLHDFTALAAACKAKGVLLVVVVTEVISLGLLPSPGSMGADIVVAEGQSIGNSLGFGGPYVGLFAIKENYLRQMPGRVCGETVDAEGKRGFVLTLSTREQHIRREKATSNICTNSGLCALAFTMHLTMLGETGLKNLAELNHARAVQAADRLAKIKGVKLLNESFFNEFTLELSKTATEVVDNLAAQKIIAGVPVSRLLPNDANAKNLLLVAVTELTTEKDIEALATALEKELAL